MTQKRYFTNNLGFFIFLVFFLLPFLHLSYYTFIYQCDQRSISYVYIQFILGRSDSWRSDWGHRCAGRYLHHFYLCMCQSLPKTKPWSSLGVPSTARGLYQFKYVIVCFKYKALNRWKKKYLVFSFMIINLLRYSLWVSSSTSITTI